MNHNQLVDISSALLHIQKAQEIIEDELGYHRCPTCGFLTRNKEALEFHKSMHKVFDEEESD